MSSLGQAADSNEMIDLQIILLELTTRFMGSVAYDVCSFQVVVLLKLIMRLQMDMPASLPFSKAFDFASGAIGDRFQNPFWKIKEFVWGTPLRHAVYEVKRFGEAIVTTAWRKRVESQVGRLKEDIKWFEEAIVSTPQQEESQSKLAQLERESKGLGALNTNLIGSLLDHISDHRVVADAAMNYLSAGMRCNYICYKIDD